MAKEEQRLNETNGKHEIFVKILNSFSFGCLDLLYGMDHDAYEHYIEDLCTNKSRLEEAVLRISPDLVTQIGLSVGNPFNRQFGQLTIYRIRIHFKKRQCQQLRCRILEENNDLLSFKKQIWPAYMGINGDCHANNRF